MKEETSKAVSPDRTGWRSPEGRGTDRERRRRRARWLLFWAAAGALAPAGRWLAFLAPAMVGRR